MAVLLYNIPYLDRCPALHDHSVTFDRAFLMTADLIS
jgi:hypothetical protein